jgi:hypothetical protein
MEERRKGERRVNVERRRWKRRVLKLTVKIERRVGGERRKGERRVLPDRRKS